MTQPNPEIIATLEPCPFCGAPASIIRANPGFDYPWFVAVKHKRSCEIALTDHCSRTSHKTRAAAIRRWNTRAAHSTKMREALWEARELLAQVGCSVMFIDALLTPLEQREDCQ